MAGARARALRRRFVVREVRRRTQRHWRTGARRGSVRRGLAPQDLTRARLVGNGHARLVSAVYRHRDLLPPRPPTALARLKAQRDPGGCDGAVDRLAEAWPVHADA